MSNFNKYLESVRRSLNESSDIKGEVEYKVRQFQKAGAIKRFENIDIEEIIDNLGGKNNDSDIDAAIRRYFNLQNWEDKGNE